MKYFALLTKLGENLLAQATALGTKIELTHMAVGDGGGKLPTPDTNQTKLIAEKRRAAINTLFIDDKNKNQIVAEQIIPEKDGGWWIREIGLFDKDGNLVAVANCPETYKPQLAEGSGRTQSIRMVLIVSHTESVTLKIDPSVVLATRAFVDDSVKKGIEEHEKSRKHPDASTTAKGFVQLADTLSADNTKAITPKLAAEINQRATNAQTTANTANTNATNANNNANNRVPSTRKVNNKPLSTDINLTASDVGAYDKSESDNKFQPKGNYLPSGYSYSKSESDNKYQQKGNYAPAGDYATNSALNNGLDKKFDKTGGVIKGSLQVTESLTTSLVQAYLDEVYVQLNVANGEPRIHSKRKTSGWRNHTLPDVSGTLMQLGDYGWGGSVENQWLLSESSISNKLRNTSTPTQVWRNNNTTKFNQNYSANAYIKCGDCWFNLSVGYGTGVLTIASGNGSTEKVSTVYSTINTLKDRNGCLKAIGTSEELSDCQVGVPLPWPQATAPAGYLICNGQSFNKTSYPLLAKAYPSGALPDLRGEFIRGLDAGRNIDSGRGVLSTQGDAIRNMTGEVHGVAIDGNGVFTSRTLVYTSATPNGSGKDMYKVTFNPSKVVPTANENRPRNIAFLYIVRAA
ncbi:MULTISPECIES: phage tail-collar fiber domain-containing protein [unclassified Providencia]|uniref:phage tail-collar fiber domain-containing protein n=1 Tax=unclassified Providencia TaxID=2633465 RepID=UPI0012B62714|nr:MULTISPECIES: phage tail protein [unclassified Providencia]MTB39307.1 hypothetical protein [Providencia sp. wls1949]MTC08158.1 hypothetical protein [Providencia sp. wls1948]